MSIELGITIGSIIAGLAAAYGIIKATVAALEKRMEKVEHTIDDCSKASLALDTQIDQLEKRACEDRERNDKQHAEFYALKEAVIVLNALVPEIIKRLDKIDSQTAIIAERLPERRARP